MKPGLIVLNGFLQRGSVKNLRPLGTVMTKVKENPLGVLVVHKGVTVFLPTLFLSRNPYTGFRNGLENTCKDLLIKLSVGN